MGFGSGYQEGFNNTEKLRLLRAEAARQAQNDQFEQAKSMAALQDDGYEYDPKANTISRNDQFGQVPAGFVRVGGKVMQDPSYTKPTSDVDQARADYYRSKSGKGTMELTPARQAVKDKKTEALFGQLEGNKVKREQIQAAEEALPRVPTGLFGKMRVMGAKMFNPNDPILGDWQQLKSVLTDAQLLNTAKTKGAISDQEMKLFAQAAANDDIVSVERVRPIIGKLKAFLDADESAAVGSYKKIYNEDPMEWPEMQQFGGGANGGAKSYNSPEEADANEAPGTVVMVQGRKYQV